MKRYVIIRVISNVLSALVSIANIMVLAGLFEIPKSIRLYVFYPLLFAMLIGSFFALDYFQPASKERQEVGACLVVPKERFS